MSQAPDTTTLPEDVTRVLRKHSGWGSAIKAGDVAAVRTLLEYQKGKGELEKDKLDLVLVKSAATLKPDMAELLLEFGATNGLLSEGLDAAQTALAAKNSALLRFFLERKIIGPNHAEEDGTTLLMAALQTEQFDLADQLVALGAQVNVKRLDFTGGGDTAFHLAARQASFQSVIWLIENGADPSIENAEGRQPSEEIPELDRETAKQWDLDSMFDALEDLKDCRKQGRTYVVPERLREMAYLEATPVSATEAALAQMAAAAQEKESQDMGLLPKKKKVGF